MHLIRNSLNLAPPEVRKIVYTTNAIESMHTQLRKIVKNRGHFPSDEAARKLLYFGQSTPYLNRRQSTQANAIHSAAEDPTRVMLGIAETTTELPEGRFI